MTNEAKEWPRLIIGQEPIMTSRSREPLYIGENQAGALFLGTEDVLNAANIHPSVESREPVRLRGEVTIGKRTVLGGFVRLSGVKIGDECELGDGTCVINSTLHNRVYIGDRASVTATTLQTASSVGTATRLNMFNPWGQEEPRAPRIGLYISLGGIHHFVSDEVLLYDRPIYYFIAGLYLKIACTTKKIVDWINPELISLSENYRILAAVNWQALLDYYVMQTGKSERSHEIQTLRAMAKLLFDQPAFKFPHEELESAKFRLPAG